VDWQSSLVESNCLVTIAARYSLLKCMKVLIEKYHASVDTADMGGFTPLILGAFAGNMPCVLYCLKKGADTQVRGRLRSV
jgi:ankyrin repeat protein